MSRRARPGRILGAHESFLEARHIAWMESGRRDFIRKALTAAATAVTLARATAVGADAKGGDDPAILDLPAHSKTLGAPVAARGYGLPSKYEANLQRWQSPGLTRVAAASVSFAPLQGFFGIVTPNGLHEPVEPANRINAFG